MNASIAPILGPQRESDAQRRVDQAVRFAVWACTQETFPAPAAIQDEFGVSRRTSGRWRKSLALALRSVIEPPPRVQGHNVKKLALPRPKTSAASVTEALLLHRAVLALPKPMLVRDIRARYGCGDPTARKAINDAISRAVVDSAPCGTGEA
jgi:hypothetical protein